jgi:hypothetical protein
VLECSERSRRLPRRRARRLIAREEPTPHPYPHCSADVCQIAPKDRRVASKPSASVAFGRQLRMRRRSYSQRWLPRKPAPPVTSARGLLVTPEASVEEATAAPFSP